MKSKIKFIPSYLIPGTGYWQVTIAGNSTNYSDHVAAYAYLNKKLKQFFKESAAFSRVQKISINLLSIEERNFVMKLLVSKCKGITVKQYGFLAGIYERQERAW